nr:ABC transporter substrate-binding protein [Neopusillimonas maritima]
MPKPTRAFKSKFSSLALAGVMGVSGLAGVAGLAGAVGIAALAALPATATAQAQQVNAKAPPNDFIKTVADNALAALRADDKAKAGDLERINALVDEYILPYVDLEKTTRLSAGRYWRQATPQQQQELVDAFKGTLIRTYSGALEQADDVSEIKPLPFRGDPEAEDVVVRTQLTQRNGPPVNVDYRMENSPNGWKIYDLNVEGIWLIQNYRNQFAQQINQNGIDGLITALNQHNAR